jgi:hypothetical protein
LAAKKIKDAKQQIISLGQLIQNLREDDRLYSLIKTTIAYPQEWFELCIDYDGACSF